MKRLIGLEMVNGIDELFGIFVFIGTEGYFKVFFCEVWYRISFWDGFVQMFFFKFEGFRWVVHGIVGQLVVKFGNLVSLIVIDELQLLDLLFFLLDNWLQLGKLLFIELLRLLIRLIGSFRYLFPLFGLLLKGLPFICKSLNQSFHLGIHELFHLLQLITESLAWLSLRLKFNDGCRQTFHLGFDLSMLLFIFVDLFELLDEERLQRFKLGLFLFHKLNEPAFLFLRIVGPVWNCILVVDIMNGGLGLGDVRGLVPLAVCISVNQAL